MCFAVPKGERPELVVQKLTELGLKVEIRRNRMVIRLPGDVLFTNVRALPDESLRSGDDWNMWLGATPMTTAIPYTLDPAFVDRAARFIGVDALRAAASSSPKTDSSAARAVSG